MPGRALKAFCYHFVVVANDEYDHLITGKNLAVVACYVILQHLSVKTSLAALKLVDFLNTVTSSLRTIGILDILDQSRRTGLGILKLEDVYRPPACLKALFVTHSNKVHSLRPLIRM